MLKSTIIVYRDIDISKFPKVIAFLKRRSEGYIPKKSSIFTREEIQRFFATAPDESFLLHKVVISFGIAGACRREELTNYCLVVTIMDSSILVQLRQTKTKIPRIFTIVDCNNGDSLNFLTVTKKFIALRPKSANNLRFFLSYKKWKCSMQPVGKNTMGKLPSVVAKYLKLPNSEGYTHISNIAFGVLPQLQQANSEADLLAVKRHGG